MRRRPFERFLRSRGSRGLRGLRRALLAPFAVVALALATTSCEVPTPALNISVEMTGLANPWDLAFTPQGWLLFTERSGNINFDNGGTKVVLAHPADVYVNSEGGMMGLAIDPNFATNRRIYTCFTSTALGVPDVRVARWVVNPGFTALTNRFDILAGGPVSNGRHSGCRVRFRPGDPNLWVTMGDAALNWTAQDPSSLGGKVLRITTDGAPAPDNPSFGFRPEVFTYGHRNPQGLAFRADGLVFEIEHGTARDDEVNLLVPGGNYGWDPKPPGGGSLYDESRPMTDLAKFPAAHLPVWSSGSPTIAPSGGTFITGAQWGPWADKLAMAVLKDHQLRVLAITSSNVLAGEGVAITDRGRLRVAVQNADGSLWLATDANPGSILRVTPG